MIAVVIGPFVGGYLADAVGYHWSYLIRRLIVPVCVLALFGMFALGAGLFATSAMVGPFVGAVLFVGFVPVNFIRNLMGM
ncbi:MAG: hypothetical protein GC155_05685 [Alphaproteobacteria bacterium]|nr:hypothetical protein [Alphaproteobacteria bacterium]